MPNHDDNSNVSCARAPAAQKITLPSKSPSQDGQTDSEGKVINSLARGSESGVRDAGAREADPTQERIRQILDYDPLTGMWLWRRRAERSVQWNGKFAGKRAGSIDSDTGYWRIRIDDVLYYAHRLAFVYVEGRWPNDEVDHDNLDRSDCSWGNLREATHSQNSLNKSVRSDSSNGLKGIYKTPSGTWVASLTVNGNRFRKHGFASSEEAHQHYCELVAALCGEYGRVA